MRTIDELMHNPHKDEILKLVVEQLLDDTVSNFQQVSI